MNFYFLFADNFHDHVDGPTSPDLPSSAAALLAQGAGKGEPIVSKWSP